MSLAFTPRARLLALVGLVAVVAAVLGLLVLGGRKSSSTAVPQVVRPLHPQRALAVARKPLEAEGLPSRLARELRRHRVVVASLVAPAASLDELALREASAGARLAGAGFVVLDVTREADARPLVSKLGAQHNPAVLVIRRPGSVVLRIDGFVDRQTVAQAATIPDS